MSSQQANEVEYINNAVQQKQEDVSHKAYNPGEDFMRNVDSTKKMIDDLLGMYKG